MDDYLTKRVRDLEVLARILAASTTITLRRGLREVRSKHAKRCAEEGRLYRCRGSVVP